MIIKNSILEYKHIKSHFRANSNLFIIEALDKFFYCCITSNHMNLCIKYDIHMIFIKIKNDLETILDWLNFF